MIHLFQAFSTIPGFTAFLGVGGWKIQTWSGRTPWELLDKNYFNLFSFFGLFLPIVAFSLHPTLLYDSTAEMEARIVQKLKAELFQELMMELNGDTRSQ